MKTPTFCNFIMRSKKSTSLGKHFKKPAIVLKRAYFDTSFLSQVILIVHSLRQVMHTAKTFSDVLEPIDWSVCSPNVGRHRIREIFSLFKGIAMR